MSPVDNLPGTPAEMADLERRVPAHERILQALIAWQNTNTIPARPMNTRNNTFAQ